MKRQIILSAFVQSFGIPLHARKLCIVGCGAILFGVFASCVPCVKESAQDDEAAAIAAVDSDRIIVPSTEEDSLDDGIIYSIDSVYQRPEFPGGEEGLEKWLASKVRYPSDCFTCASGREIVKFVITKTGTIRNIEIVRGLAPEFDKEALLLLKEMPNWTPGRDESGQPVNVSYTLPIIYKLQ